MYGAGDSLSKHLSKDNSDALNSFCTKCGFPRQGRRCSHRAKCRSLYPKFLHA